MHEAAARLPALHPAAIAGAAIAAAFLGGAAIAAGVPVGLGLVIATLYMPVVLLNLPLAIALWLPLVFVENLNVVSVAPTAAGLLLLVAWFGAQLARGSEIAASLRRHVRVLAVVAGLLLWFTLSAAWAERPSLVGDVLWQWLIAGLTFLVVATALNDRRAVKAVLIGFVVGAMLSVLIGLAENDFSSSDTARQVAVDQGSRVQGGSGDPNDLAAGLVPALVLGAGLLTLLRGPFARVSAVLALFVIATGFAAAESRGALVAAATATLAAFVFYRGRRAYVVVLLAFLVGSAAVWFSIFPDAWQRITTFNNAGNGREEFWSVAWQIWQDHPIQGVGLNNYLEASPDYVRRPGSLKFVELIADKPHVAHNTYLQMLAETGVIGLALFLSAALGALRAAWLAAARFDVLGDRPWAIISRSVLVAGISMLVGSFFLTNGADKRMWVLLALGPVLLGIARRSPPPPEPTEPHPRPGPAGRVPRHTVRRRALVGS